MLCKTETNRTADNFKSVGSSDQSEFHLKDSTSERLVWKRANPNNLMIIHLEKLIEIIGHSVLGYTKKVKKQVKQLKRF
jgi:hypothetical protein